MAVIVTGMYEPECCKDCYLSAGYGCEIKGQIMTTEEMKSCDPDCPIRSIDGLIDKINSCWYIDKVDKEYAVKIIKDYCGEGEQE